MSKKRPLEVKFSDLKSRKERNDNRIRHVGYERTRKERGPGKKRNNMNMVRYRIAIGHKHKASPGDIVGAIANEAGLDSKHIGQINLYDEFSIVDLPEGMPKEIFKSLRGVYVRGQKLSISVLKDGDTNEGRSRKNERKRTGAIVNTKKKIKSGKKGRKKGKNEDKPKRKSTNKTRC